MELVPSPMEVIRRANARAMFYRVETPAAKALPDVLGLDKAERDALEYLGTLFPASER